jgi:hypothetical protein
LLSAALSASGQKVGKPVKLNNKQGGKKNVIIKPGQKNSGNVKTIKPGKVLYLVIYSNRYQFI